MEGYTDVIESIASSLRAKTKFEPKVGIILGSGLSKIADSVPGESIDYGEIAGFPEPTVEGHRGFVKVNENFAFLAGRFHYYEGHSMREVIKPVLLLKALGVERLIVTNAAGGVNRGYHPGQIVLIKDYINLMGSNPLVGPNEKELGPRFPDMSDTFSKALRARIQQALKEPLAEGVYAAMSGPCYESPAEIRMLETIGADVVGMSTVPEAMMANYMGMETVGFSCVTNMAAGILDQPLNHQEVIETAARVEEEFRAIVETVMELLLKQG